MDINERRNRQSKAKAIINWFAQYGELPNTLQIDSGRKALDLPQYVNTHIGWLQTLEPDKEAYRLAYYRLWEIKQRLINLQNK